MATGVSVASDTLPRELLLALTVYEATNRAPALARDHVLIAHTFKVIHVAERSHATA